MNLLRAAAFATLGAAGGFLAGLSPVGANPSQGDQARDTLRFVAHSQYATAGMTSPRDPLILRNPFEGNKDAIADGAKLYVAYNCIDCHGADGSGAMAPAFSDGRWHFGGTAAEVFESIYQGRPEGMPAWGGLIDRASAWRLVSYVRSLDTGKDVSTENFTGKTVERTGH